MSGAQQSGAGARATLRLQGQAYRAAQQQVRRERGERCECCKVPARATHHINSIGVTGIASPLASEPANLLIVCDDCHTMFHPGRRSYPWASVGARRWGAK